MSTPRSIDNTVLHGPVDSLDVHPAGQHVSRRIALKGLNHSLMGEPAAFAAEAKGDPFMLTGESGLPRGRCTGSMQAHSCGGGRVYQSITTADHRLLEEPEGKRVKWQTCA